MNNVALVGRATKDPEITMTQNGKEKATFRIAVNRDFKNQDGEYEADFINCVAFGNVVNVIRNYVTKGSMIGIIGAWQTSTFPDKTTGKDVFLNNCVIKSLRLLESKKNNGMNPQEYSANSITQPVDYNEEILDSDLPF